MKKISLLFFLFGALVAESQLKSAPADSAAFKAPAGTGARGAYSLKSLVVIDGEIWGYAGSFAQLDSLMAPGITAGVKYLTPGEAVDKYESRASKGAIEITRKTTPAATNEEDKLYTAPDQQASFPGGARAWRDYLQHNLNGMVPTDSGAPAGYYDATVRFVVNKDGKLSDFIAESHAGYGTEQELIRVLRKGPDWLPGRQSGRPVKSYFIQKASFVVESYNFSIDFREGIRYQLVSGTPQTVDITPFENPEDGLEVTLSEGTVQYQKGTAYALLVKQKGTVILTVRNKKNKTELGKVSITVR